MNMKKFHITIISLAAALSAAAAPRDTLTIESGLDTISLGYGIEVSDKSSAFVHRGVGRSVFEKSPDIDAAKALYGQIAGLNVYQGSGTTYDNIAPLSIHGRTPLILVDGFPRGSLRDITTTEIESVAVLTDAAAAAMYGMRGANGVVLVTTRRATPGKLRVGADFQYGINSQFRSPEFADAYTYATTLNQALILDGLSPQYNSYELEAFRTGQYPYEYPDVNWWDEIYKDYTSNYRLGLTFEGGTEKFRYYSVVDYMYDIGLFRNLNTDSRYSTMPSDVRLSIRSNFDVEVTRTTHLKLGIMGKIGEYNRARGASNVMSNLYITPSAAYPVKQYDGVWGGTDIYTATNPVANLADTGNYRFTTGTVVANMSLRQDLDIITEGLAAEVLVSFENTGRMYDETSKNFVFEDSNATMSDGHEDRLPGQDRLFQDFRPSCGLCCRHI